MPYTPRCNKQLCGSNSWCSDPDQGLCVERIDNGLGGYWFVVLNWQVNETLTPGVCRIWNTGLACNATKCILPSLQSLQLNSVPAVGPGFTVTPTPAQTQELSPANATKSFAVPGVNTSFLYLVVPLVVVALVLPCLLLRLRQWIIRKRTIVTAAHPYEVVFTPPRRRIIIDSVNTSSAAGRPLLPPERRAYEPYAVYASPLVHEKRRPSMLKQISSLASWKSLCTGTAAPNGCSCTSVHGRHGPSTLLHVPKEIETCVENEAVIVFGKPPSYQQALLDELHANRTAHRSRFFRAPDTSPSGNSRATNDES
ncbi:hypothetical protein SeLEV6574_g02938 [Synchytrium endobioticum]|nr:hypothetical protein SeLEV6574_g02938 [Synchytrium endobioticum]